MAPKPTKPSNVKVKDLQNVLETLQRIQEDVNNPPPGSFDGISLPLESDLVQGDGSGMQGNAPHIAGQRYSDNVHYINQGWGDVKQGIGALITMLQTTIAKHSTADSNAQTGAQRTNTSQSTATPGRG